MAEAKRSHSGTIATRLSLPMAVAPTVDGNLFNTIRQPLAPVACFTIAAPGFDFDSSLLLPEMRRELVKLGRLLARFPEHPLSIFGHADPTGSDDYNKELAGRRALSVYALLTHQPALWENLWKSGSKAKGDHWTQRTLLVMLGELFSPATGEPYFAGTPTDARTQATDDAIRAFQQDHDLTVDGDAGPQTRAKLFELYMDLLTESNAGTAEQPEPSKVQVPAGRFLGQGANADGKGDYQSCGEFNPAVVLSKDEVASLSDEDRDHENAANRRVVIYLFKRGTQIDLGKWPCPTVKEGPSGCKRRFWSDGDRRRAAGDERRTFDETQDTFGCRFYQRIAGGSPCERPTSITFSVEVLFDLPGETKAAPQSFTLASTDASFTQTLPASAVIRVDADQAALVFTGVRRGKSYTLCYALADGGTIAVFTSVPFVDLDDFGDDTDAPDALVLADPPQDQPAPQPDDPLLAFDETTVDAEPDDPVGPDDEEPDAANDGGDPT